MSARVFKPISLETLKLHKPEPSRTHVRTGIARVRRSLFGPINHAETQRFLEDELAKESRNSADKWQFNFAVGKPLVVSNDVRFVWEPVKPKEITYAPTRRSTATDGDNEECYPRHLDVRQDVAEDEAGLEMETAATTGTVLDAQCANLTGKTVPILGAALKTTVQSRMTDFMQVRKRSADAAFVNKKSSSPCGPSKLKISRSSNNLGS